MADPGQGETETAQERPEELRAKITGPERRIGRQVANLEAKPRRPHWAPVGARIAELEQALEERRQHANTLAAQSAEAPPAVADLTTALNRLPPLTERLRELPSRHLSWSLSAKWSIKEPKLARAAAERHAEPNPGPKVFRLNDLQRCR